MTAAEAVRQFVADGALVGMGGQSIGRSAMCIYHEMIRQKKKDLTLVGCNLSIPMDMMVGLGLVRRTECGTGNLERFGTTHCWRKAVEQGKLVNEDYSHLAMVSRFLGGEMGLPFMAIRSLLGSDILAKKCASTGKKYEIIDNPWNPGEKVVLLPSLNPDVSIIHAQKADETGNLIIEGFLAHEPEMTRASKAVIVSCEEVVSSDEIRQYPERTTIPYVYVSAVVHQPWGAHPTSVYRCYAHDGEHIREYQKAAREGGVAFEAYTEKYIFSCGDFDQYLEKVGGFRKYNRLRQEMVEML
ncbi:MAG: coenzyme transferase [Deltaproteobacteria bacterium]|jgi:acyl CoA:acetate/3-ketoacid CoA transferase alpha subunit|nr:coenzyme transferase [Deltaproteobacteria bacterium]